MKVDAMKRMLAPVRRWLKREDGTASIELVMVLPPLIWLFCMAFESGLLLTRHVMLDRALDITMRELRLNHYENPDHDLIKDEVCKFAAVIPNCNNVIRLHLEPISTATWVLPNATPTCVDRAEEVNPMATWNSGVAEDVMFVQVCVVADALFPTLGMGALMEKDGNGGYMLLTRSAFVNEPT